MDKDKAREIIKARDMIFASQLRMLELSGLTPCDYNCQWISEDGEHHWPDEALRLAEGRALDALGLDPFKNGRMP